MNSNTMKTKIFTLIITVCIFLVANTQNTVTNKSNAGIKFGYNLAAVSFDGATETGQRQGFHVGFYGESFLAERIALQIELLYSQQGYEIEDDGGTFTQKLNYINLPLSLRLYPTQNFFLEAGPQIGLAISHKEEFDRSFNLFDTEQEFDPNNFDYGVNFGVGFKTDSGISLGIRYLLGLGDIYDEGNPKNRVLQFSLGFDF
jgi:hypothetical protein